MSVSLRNDSLEPDDRGEARHISSPAVRVALNASPMREIACLAYTIT